jgi:hypothetical protein
MKVIAWGVSESSQYRCLRGAYLWGPSIVMGLDIRKHDGIIESDTGRIGVEGFKIQYSWWLSITSFFKDDQKYIRKEMV